MSNNVSSHQFMVSNSQMNDIHVSEKSDIPVSDVQGRMMGQDPGAPLQEFAMSNGQLGFKGPAVNGSVSHNGLLSNNQTGQLANRLDIRGSQQFLSPDQKFGHIGTLTSSPGAPMSLLSKRKAEGVPASDLSVSQQMHMPNKRLAQMGTHNDGFLQPKAMSKKGVAFQPKNSSPTLHVQNPSKKISRNDSGKSVSQRVQPPKGRTVQVDSSSKASSELNEAVRSKMRESLASALELACQNQDNSVNEDKRKSESPGNQITETTKPSESDQDAPGASSVTSENAQNSLPTDESTSADISGDGQGFDAALPNNEIGVDSEQGFKDLNCTSDLTTDDFPFAENFFIRDELLQGNGLSWAWEFDMASRETCEVVNDVKPEVVDVDDGVDKCDQGKPSPQDLAFEIEAELFKLFGGVNKKYKEKGRSLLFNLKDRNNPELRERVMSGEISPEKLCSMTAEELASKELSEWRMAKAEEFAQMVVLPDTDVNMRRLVKKTHKGEYQVEVEKEDENAAIDVSAGTSAIVLSRPKLKDEEVPAEDDVKDKENAIVQQSRGENQTPSGRLVIPNDDMMKGMIVDEMKDAEFLPPIVSLDEFMESLHSEPLFENLPVDAGQAASSGKEKSDASPKPVASDVSSTEPLGTSSDKVTEARQRAKYDAAEKRKKSPSEVAASVVGSLWQGSVQLNISSSVSVIGAFRSGEKTPTKEWPASLEVKGRVRMEAFEKFLQDLRMSRSRAVMVVHFSLKDSSSEEERSSLSEAVESYVSDERVGIAEPAPGVELYLCPPHTRILDILSKHLSTDRAEFLDSTDNGLVGVVVWRKVPLTSSISPNSSSHHKSSSLKRQQLAASRRQPENVGNVNGNMMTKGHTAYAQHRPSPQLQQAKKVAEDDDDDDDDDVPPGFGPAAGPNREDDDLPEFNFSGNVNHQSVNRILPHKPAPAPSVVPLDRPLPNRPVDQMRELVKKYGQYTGPPDTGGAAVGGIGLEPWDDDDDDIPEWRPNQPTQSFQQPNQPTVLGQHLPRHVAAPSLDTMQQHLHPNAATSWQPGAARWGNPSRPDLSLGNQLPPGQGYGTPPPRTGRQGVPRSRAF